ncbi:response regulator [Roseococcus sp. YIM B11640]|uniref:hybrid sensor histidine kinase/response regulator n=1 Tax=Roseococcus sp. YIM B11640 TaxID=3133973 RepID=UPI003C7A9576
MKLASHTQDDTPLIAFIAVSIALTFLADIFMPLGIAVWIVYLLPAAFAYLCWRPRITIMIAAATTILIILGYFLSPPGGDPELARINRGFGVLTAWIIGVTGYFFIKTKIAVQRQEWLQSAQVGLAARIGGEQRMDQLAENMLGQLAEQLGASAGAVFIQNGDGFHRYATFGVPADAPMPEKVEAGDGLLGQAIRDRKCYVLTDVPEGYLYFGSGLGRGSPKSLLIAPIMADDQVNGVLELGFQFTIGERKVALLEQVSQAMGVAIRSAKYRVRLQEFLEETQRQAAELQTQSEELRASNEELAAQTDELKQSQTELERQQAALERSNAELEEQARQLEIQRDDLAQTQAALQSQAKILEQANQYKSEFVANMSHELRTPLNSLLILARLLAENRTGNLNAEQIKYARTIEGSGNDLLLLINDILDISKIEAGRLDMQPSVERIAPIVEKLAGSFRPLAAQKGLDLRAEIAADAPAEIESDLQRVEQVLKNFLSNAVKFTERGEVRLSVSRRPDRRIAFTVRDTGIGIPADQQEAIFEAFRQADGTISRKYGGTGLGLSISRELARLLGGHIEVESRAGQGSAFTLILPEVFSPAQVAPQGAPPVRQAFVPALLDEPRPAPVPTPRRAAVEDDREALENGRRAILVVEDDPAFSRILYDLAHELGFQCIIARTADEGAEAARQYLPHAIILDMGLPDHSGLSVLDRVKRDVRTRHIPVHVVSVSDYTQAAMAFGAISYMLKPVKREQLVEALQSLDDRLTEQVRRILIVEDNETQLDSLRSLLGSDGVETYGARTAAACLEELRKRTFDCLVLDLSLPDASGFEVLEKLNADEDSSFPPVIVYTGRDLSAEEELRLRRHSRSIIIKGAKSPERLLDEVTLFLHQVVAELPDQQQRMLARSMNRDAAIEGRNILVVEDDVRNVFALTSIFEPHGATVTIARNGLEALSALRAAREGKTAPVDIVLMDVMMPEMDGLTATREIRREAEWKSLPIIALTAKARPEDQAQCLAAGASDYLAKPLDVDKLLSLVRVWMPR